MLKVARYFLIVMAIMFIVMGLLALLSPQKLAEQLALMPQLPKGLAELRGLYGGLFLSWGGVVLLSLRNSPASTGLALSVAISLGAIALARVVSLAIDHEAAFNIPAAVFEGLVALASWAVYRSK